MSDEECASIRCHKPATHTVTMRVNWPEGDSMVKEIEYCLDDALYFAAWLPYCYPGEHELISITPPASELFERHENG